MVLMTYGRLGNSNMAQTAERFDSHQHLGCIPLLRFKRKSQLKKQFVATGFALSLRCCWDRYMDTVEDPAGTTELTPCSRCHGDRTAANLRKGIAGAAQVNTCRIKRRRKNVPVFRFRTAAITQ